MMEWISIPGVLKATMLDGLYKPEDCQLITPAEYDLKYGEKNDA